MVGEMEGTNMDKASDNQAKALPVPVLWEELPDLGLYMDQVIQYLERQHRAAYAEGERFITPAIINNYVKQGLVMRPSGKKYDRPHLAQLMMIMVFKQSLSVENIKRLTGAATAEEVQARYHDFCRVQQQALDAFSALNDSVCAMASAIYSAFYRIRCEKLLQQAADKTPPPKG